jgi:Mg-chelatase subunit ChlD
MPENLGEPIVTSRRDEAERTLRARRVRAFSVLVGVPIACCGAMLVLARLTEPELVAIEQIGILDADVEHDLAGEGASATYDLVAMEMIEADDSGGAGHRHCGGEEGEMGLADAPQNANRFAIRGPADNMDPSTARERALDYAASSGILSVLQSNAPASPFGQDAALAVDPEGALGVLMDNRIGDAYGYGGLGLRGTGRGVGRGGGGLSARGGGGLAAVLPTSGVLASNFVGGRGAEARFEDLIERGVMVGGENVRIEAFEDRQRLSYPVPSQEAVALYAELERTRVVAAGDRAHLQITLVARQGETPVQPRMDVRLVLDRSGSMADENKWENAVAAAVSLVARLDDDDTFGLISYSDEATLDITPRRVGPHRDGVVNAIRSLSPGGNTNIGAALQLAQLNRPRRGEAGGLGLVVLISDGQATTGVMDPTYFGSLARQMFDEDGVLTTAIGLGTEFDEETMLTIAREGSGSYHFVRRAGDIEHILQDELEDRAQAVAQGLRVRVVLAPGVTARHVYGSRLLSEQEHAAVRASEVAVDRRLARELGVARDRQHEEEEGLRIHLGSFRRGDQHVILMELDVPPGAVASRAPIAQVFLDYKDLGQRSNEHVVTAVTATRVGGRDEALASVVRPVKRTVLAFQAGEALQAAAGALEVGDAVRARHLLVERRELLEAAAELWRDPALRRDAALIGRYEAVVASAYPSWPEEDQHTLLLAMNHFADRRMR